MIPVKNVMMGEIGIQRMTMCGIKVGIVLIISPVKWFAGDLQVRHISPSARNMFVGAYGRFSLFFVIVFGFKRAMLLMLVNPYRKGMRVQKTSFIFIFLISILENDC